MLQHGEALTHAKRKKLTQQAAYRMIPFVRNVKNRRLHSDKKQISGLYDLGVGKMRSDC